MSKESDRVDRVLAEFGERYGMTADQAAAWLLVVRRRHENAPADVCGVVDPRDWERWCVQRTDHPGAHNGHLPKDGCTAWADHCPRCAEHLPCACRFENGGWIQPPKGVVVRLAPDECVMDRDGVCIRPRHHPVES